MKNLKIFGYVLLSMVAVIYLAFLVVVPNVIKVDKYKPEIQKLVKDNTGFELDFGKVDIITTPILEAGIKAKDIKVKLPDGSVLFSADSVKGKVFLPSLLALSVRVSCVEVEAPKLNAEIENSEKFKFAKAYEDVVNKQRQERRLQPRKPIIQEEQSLVDVSKIKIFVPNVKINNYQAVIDDVKASHKLTLKGEKLRAGYFNGKVAKLKTYAEMFSDEDKNITANIDINTFIPEFSTEVEEVDDEAVFALPFINPVKTYRDYSLKSNIDTKLKIRTKKGNRLWAKGYFNIGDTTVTLAGLELPKSYFNVVAKGQTAEFDTNLYVTDKENLKLFGLVNYSKKPYIDFSLKSSQVHFANILTIAKAYLDTVHIKNDIDNMSASGYLLSNFRLKTDFRNLESDGKFVIREGNVSVKNIGLLFNDINANLLFDDNIFRVENTHVLINNRPLHVSGKIDSDSIAQINVSADRIPLPELYLAFAPKDVKRSYNLSSGFLTLKAKVTGEIKDIAAMFKADVENLNLADRAGNFVITNDLFRLGVANISGEIYGKLKNKGFRFNIPATSSVIYDDLLVADINSDNIIVNDSTIGLNKVSNIVLNGRINDYISQPAVSFVLDGVLADSDLKTLVGPQVAPYLDSKGSIPVKANFESKGKKSKLVLQLQSSPNSYITPVKFDDFVGKQLLVQLLAELNGDTLNIYKTGLYLRKPNAPFRDNLSLNLLNAQQVVGIRSMLSNLSTDPFINIFKVTVPNDLKGSICAFPKSSFTTGGQLFVFGKVGAPRINGNFNIRNLQIPEILTSIRHIFLGLATNDVRLNINDVNANGSDFNVNVRSTWEQLADMKIADVKVNSRLINLDKLMQVSDALTKTLPQPAPTQTKVAAQAPVEIPVEVLGGDINLRRITTGNIVVRNTTGKISLFKNIFYLNNLRTLPMDGVVNGDVSVNLVSMLINTKLRGTNFDVEKVLLDAMNMKDTLAGTLDFVADLSLQGLTMEEQMTSLKGFVDFNVKDGQLGPFGKFENFLMAENLRENAFFSSTIGSVITNIVTIDTSRFSELYGHMTFDNGFANIAPIKSHGNVMSLFIAGKVGLLDSSADMKLRGKLGSTFSDSLGPLANINPVNLVKNTPGLNIVAAKTFAIFCEELSQEEMDAIPELGAGKSDEYATKFQIVLRGDTRKPLKLIKSFKWLALDSEIQSAKDFVDTMPIPQPGEENMSVEQLVELRAQQAAGLVETPKTQVKKEKKSFFARFRKDKEE